MAVKECRCCSMYAVTALFFLTYYYSYYHFSHTEWILKENETCWKAHTTSHKWKQHLLELYSAIPEHREHVFRIEVKHKILALWKDTFCFFLPQNGLLLHYYTYFAVIFSILNTSGDRADKIIDKIIQKDIRHRIDTLPLD